MKRSLSRAIGLVAGLLPFAAWPLQAQAPSFSKYVAVGDSYGAGFGAGCLVAREQRFSYPNILAQQFGVSGFQQPTVSDPGIPVCTGVRSLVPIQFGPISTTKVGLPTNLMLGRSYDNLSVPGFKIADVSDTMSGGAADFILRGRGSALNQALSLNPTFLTLGIIGNDILTAGGAGFLLDGVTATPLNAFTTKYNAVAAALKASGRTGVFIGTPDARLIPLATTLTRFVPDPTTGRPILVGGNPVPLLGPGNAAFPCPSGVSACPLPPGTLVTLGANAPQTALGGRSLLGVGFGVPCLVAPMLPQCGQPLPDGGFTPPATVNVGVLLYPNEVQMVDDRIKAMNSVIKSAAETNGFKYFDFYALSQDLIANGRTIGGIRITKDFVTGGMFAFGDAVHMSNIGYAILADELVQFINSSFGTNLERPGLSEALFTPDGPAPGTTSIGAASSAEPILFTEDMWKGFFQTFPLQDAALRLVLPAGADPVESESLDRAPVVPIRHGRR